MNKYCGLSKTGKCNCKQCVGYAMQKHRLNPDNLEYSKLARFDEDTVNSFTRAMEEIDELTLIFAELPKYRSPDVMRNFVEELINSFHMSVIKEEYKERSWGNKL